MPDKTIEIELALQDSTSAVLQDIAKSVGDVVKHIGEMGKASSGTDSGITRTAKSVQGLTDKSKESTKSLEGISLLFMRLAGPAGIAASIGVGLVAAANAMDAVSGKRLRFENLSTDLGFTVDQMSIMIRTFEAMGMSAKEAEGHLSEVGTTLKRLQTYGEGSEVFKTLSTMGRNEFAKQLRDTVKGADGMYRGFLLVNQEYNRIFNEEGPRAASNFLATINGFRASVAKDFAERSKGVTAGYQISKETTEEFRGHVDDLKTFTYGALNQLSEIMMGFSLKMETFLGGYSLEDFFKKKPPTLPNSEKSLGGTPKDKQSEEEKQLKKDSNEKLGKIRDSIRGLGSPNSAGGARPKQHGGSVEAGQSYLVGEARPEMYTGGGNIQVVGMGGPEVIQPQYPGMINPSVPFPQFVPNMHTPRVQLPPFENRYGDWNAKSFEDRFGDWSTPSVGERFGDWTTKGGGTRPSPGSSTSPWRGEMSEGPDISSYDRRALDLTLNAQSEAPSLNAQVVFKNVPEGVMTKADGNGFDNFSVDKSKALV